MMNAPKVTDVASIQFLIAAQRVYTCIEAAGSCYVAHAFNQRMEQNHIFVRASSI